ncbi:hypothetical protein [Arthrobacter bambusae]|uniref:hypothetical protein n=1 Tax=Arthrobacter bambusae TaxID=1338426 RepID=UPI0027832A6A|nr:hypothetical protein [Arthrobacter bambusae]MDQ0030931.1 hypothetical protein [Arthrobacter bambusae]MDQ0099296.1 hypothetical protein [Arthrobacter bambusae]
MTTKCCAHDEYASQERSPAHDGSSLDIPALQLFPEPSPTLGHSRAKRHGFGLVVTVGFGFELCYGFGLGYTNFER